MSLTRRSVFTNLGLLANAASAVRPLHGADRSTAENIQTAHKKALTKLGYRTKVDGDGDLTFSRNGKIYYVDITEDDPLFLRIVLANVWQGSGVHDHGHALDAASHSNAECKGSKAFLIKDRLCVSVEMLLPELEASSAVIERALDQIDNGLASFAKHMKRFADE